MDIATFGAFAAINFAAASSGGIFKPGAWYEGLSKPAWTPPNWAFPLVWSVLFLMNALAGALAWEAAAGGGLSLPFIVYGVSLAVNAAWSFLFFGMKRMDLALVDVVLLWLTVFATMALFAPINPISSLLIAPYLVWVTIAGVLTLRMLQLNASYGAPSGEAGLNGAQGE